MVQAEQIDVIIRFHDARRLAELERCMFSLYGQYYRPLHVTLVLQRFTVREREATEKAIEPIQRLPYAPSFSLLNWAHAEPYDARSALLNYALRSIRGRYLAFLDYDDVLYPEAYKLLAARIQQTGAAMVFASIRIVDIEVYDDVFYAKGLREPFAGSGLLDLFKRNFCPIHSYLIDRSKVPDALLFFEPFLTVEEDYDFLLRMAAQVKTDFGLVGTEIGDYYYKSDGSNTVPTHHPVSAEGIAAYEQVLKFIEQRRVSTPISVEVQRELGLGHVRAGFSVRDAIQRAEGK